LLHIPPLRERRSEILPLAVSFVASTAAELNLDVPRIGEKTMELLNGYAWPGNIRELRNAMERAVLLAAEGVIEPMHLPDEKLSMSWGARERPPARELSPQDKAARDRILVALERCAGNQTRAAEVLGMSRQTLSKWIGRYAIPRPRKKSPGFD